jgi:hypothetical protein
VRWMRVRSVRSVIITMSRSRASVFFKLRPITVLSVLADVSAVYNT